MIIKQVVRTGQLPGYRHGRRVALTCWHGWGRLVFAIGRFTAIVLTILPFVGSGAHGADATVVTIPYVIIDSEKPLPISRLTVEPDDIGIKGADLAIKDNNTTGRFMKQAFKLEVLRAQDAADALSQLDPFVAAGAGMILIDAVADQLLEVADGLTDKDALLFNLRAIDTRLRNKDCRANVLHVSPSRAMLADGLAQYLIWKRWRKWFLVYGANPDDQAFAAAIRRAAKKFGGRIVEERVYEDSGGSRRTDTGHAQIQKQMPVFTQNAANHDVLVVADESQVFGPYVAYRVWTPRPVVGTSGLVASSWHPAHEQWGATQMQNRFQRLAKRFMQPMDYHAWLGVRAIGVAATRTNSGNFKTMRDYLLSDKFAIAAFKGQKVSFRKWNRQLRQPVLLANLEVPVSWSPQPGFLHKNAEVDSLGLDEPESQCQLN